jgi:hypothetical protein
MADAVQQPRRARALVLKVLALGLPSVAFVVCHVILERLKDEMPEWLDLRLAWTMVTSGMLGALTTAGALVVAVVASFLRSVPTSAKALIWTFVAISLLALVYLAQVPP